MNTFYILFLSIACVMGSSILSIRTAKSKLNKTIAWYVFFGSFVAAVLTLIGGLPYIIG